MQAKNVDAKTVGRDALAVERVDTASFAEVVTSSLRVKLILGKRFLARQELKLTFMNLDHECVLAPTNRAITHGEFRKVSFDLEAHGTTMTTALVLLH